MKHVVNFTSGSIILPINEDAIGLTRKYLLRGYILGSGAPGGIFSPLTHMEQLLLVTSYDSPAGIGSSLPTDNGQQMDGQTWRLK